VEPQALGDFPRGRPSRHRAEELQDLLSPSHPQTFSALCRTPGIPRGSFS
jgi:hypothetical protein